MRDSKEREHRISNLKDMFTKISENEETLESFDYEEEISDEYEIVDAEEMIKTLSEDSENNKEELIIDEDFIYKMSDKDKNETKTPTDNNNDIDKNYIIRTNLKDDNFQTSKTDDFNDDYNDYDLNIEEDEEYIDAKFDKLVNKKIGKYSLTTIVSLIVGLILIILGILRSVQSSARIIDSVTSGETNSSAAIFILIGIFLLIIAIYKMVSIKSPFDGVINSIKSVEDEKEVIEQKSLANDNKKVKKVGEFDIKDIKTKLDNPNNELNKVKHKTEDKKPTEEELAQEELEYEKAKLDSETIDDIFANMEEIEDVPIISIDSKEKE